MPQQDLSDFTTTQVVHFSRANDENIGGAVLIGQTLGVKVRYKSVRDSKVLVSKVDDESDLQTGRSKVYLIIKSKY